MAAWSNPQENGAQSLFVPAYLGGEAFLMENDRGSRDIHYLTPPNGSAWRVVATTPYENVLNQALANSLPVMFILFAVTAVFYARFTSYGQNLAGPISELARASRTIAAGGSLTTPVDVDRQDEVGELGRAFTGMQRALKGRLDELSLLLEVSQDISTSMNINHSMPVILQGAVRGTGAIGARAVILNPRGRAPLAFAEGPAGKEMKLFDRTLMLALRDKKDLAFSSPRRMGQMFGLHVEEMPVKSLFAIPLHLDNKFQGVFYLGYRKPREFDKSEQDLLHTLAGQAAVLVENAHLYARAESGRQRLQAVLSSTTEAVIVTDQTERVFMLNKAMAEAFQLSLRQAIGRAVGDVIESEALVKALTQTKAGERNLEIRGKDGRTYVANISPIVSRRRRLMGRVAVLHDVTRFKEANSLKSEFVSNVSHDLKTPLTIISQSASELGMGEELSEQHKRLTGNIIAAVDRIVQFVDTMLDIERLEAGTELVYTRFDVGELLEELAVDQWYYAHSSGLTIHTKMAAGLPPITADRAALYQAVENLLANAIKYAPQSGELLLAAGRQDDQVVISLRDKGPGIADQDQIHLFEKGYRVKRHGTGKVKGSGMGLAYVKTAAERHGGRAWCESVLGKGSTFYISVPVERENS
jgi:PAS domain S-box-containing protein